MNILPEKGEVYYYPSFFSVELCDDFYEKLVNKIQWKQEPIWMFGKKVMQPRLTALYGNPSVAYGYSGIKMQPYPWTDFLLQIKEAIEQVADTDFTHVLLNYYRDGKDSMGWHRDNEPELGKNPVIGSVSFGYPRRFQFRLYNDKSKKKELLLEHGSFLLMRGETQHYWEHQIPKSQKVQGARINLTFRKILK
ncbi:alpha-ketoglutarate-dependent dioxygenase AlkB [Cecembia sp.]|uniref:alpha-ketoglutarate-dependent dioxygenase AlkB family protein n=1 Tax=Cecembia sp. TaxID=1898110 RepID=UPI0025C5ED0B|nr:alpha-ketoglutarate-dependent dioxygenase AlkB [Cecembia sp.]